MFVLHPYSTFPFRFIIHRCGACSVAFSRTQRAGHCAVLCTLARIRQFSEHVFWVASDPCALCRSAFTRDTKSPNCRSFSLTADLVRSRYETCSSPFDAASCALNMSNSLTASSKNQSSGMFAIVSGSYLNLSAIANTMSNARSSLSFLDTFDEFVPNRSSGTFNRFLLQGHLRLHCRQVIRQACRNCSGHRCHQASG